MSNTDTSQAERDIFIRLLALGDKEAGLCSAIETIKTGHGRAETTWIVDSGSFSQVPGSPFAYWVDESLRHMFSQHPALESEGRTVRVGLQTSDDFRFARTLWEVPVGTILDASNCLSWKTDVAAYQRWCRERSFQGKRWAVFAKGGEYSPFYSDLHLLVNWERDGEEIRNYIDTETGRT